MDVFFCSADTKDRPERFLDFSVSVPSSVYIPPVSFAHVTVSAPQKCATCRVSAPESARAGRGIRADGRGPPRRPTRAAPSAAPRARSGPGSPGSTPARSHRRFRFRSRRPCRVRRRARRACWSRGPTRTRPANGPAKRRVHLLPSRHPRVHGNSRRSRAAYSPTGGPIPSACAVTRARRARASKSATFSGSSSASESKKKGNASLAARHAAAEKSAARGRFRRRRTRRFRVRAERTGLGIRQTRLRLGSFCLSRPP